MPLDRTFLRSLLIRLDLGKGIVMSYSIPPKGKLWFQFEEPGDYRYEVEYRGKREEVSGEVPHPIGDGLKDFPLPLMGIRCLKVGGIPPLKWLPDREGVKPPWVRHLSNSLMAALIR